jgi:prepilin-type processing-associated H-X9-DG protein
MENTHMVADDLEHCGGGDEDPRSVSRHTPDAFICPSADKMSLEERIDSGANDCCTSKGNYVASWGSCWIDGEKFHCYLGYDPTLSVPSQIVNKRGAFNVVMVRGWKNVPDGSNADEFLGKWKMGLGEGTKLSQISDGASNTLLVSEVVGFDDNLDGRGGWVLQAMGASNFSARFPPNAFGNILDPDPAVNNKSFPSHDRIAQCANQKPNTIPPTNPLFCERQMMNDDQVWASARSRHQGGVNAAMCDGSVRFVSNTINLALWRVLATRDGGETLTEP